MSCVFITRLKKSAQLSMQLLQTPTEPLISSGAGVNLPNPRLTEAIIFQRCSSLGLSVQLWVWMVWLWVAWLVWNPGDLDFTVQMTNVDGSEGGVRT